MHLIICLRDCQYYFELGRIAELLHDLAADAARRTILRENAILASDDGYSIKFSDPFGYRPEKGCPLGTVRGGEGDIFYIASAIDFSVLRKKRRTNLKMAVIAILSFRNLFPLLLQASQFCSSRDDQLQAPGISPHPRWKKCLLLP